MAMFRFVFRKMWNTRWLTLSTLVGLIIAVAFSTSIPMYANGSLKRVVESELQENNSGLPAGSILIRYQAVGSEKPDLDSLNDVNQYIEQDIPEAIGFPQHNYVRNYSLRSSNIKPANDETADTSRRRQMSVMTLTDFENHVDILNGTMFSDQVDGDIIEAVVLQDSLYSNYFQIGDVFSYPISGGNGIQPLKIKIVGTYEPKAPENPYDAYWFQGLDSMLNTFIINEKVFQEELLEKKNVPLDVAKWYYNIDLREIQTSQLSALSSTLEEIDSEVYQLLKNTKVDLSFDDMLKEFRTQSLQLQSLLFTLAAPMIAMVFYYIAMNSKQSLERQRSDIAVLRSRGGSTRQIFMVYFLEGLLLGGTALILGPLIGWFMAKSIGSSNGFLTFVNRKSIPVDINMDAVLYGVLTVVIALLASLIPALSYARKSIVNVKQSMARADRNPFWMRWFIDIALVAVSGYGWYMFNENKFLSMRSGLSSNELQVQPLLFFVPALTIFSLGLVFLRIFPWLLKLFNWIGRKFMPVPLFLTLTQLSRSAKAYYPLMLLLILTLGLGVYNASSARTIDLNSTERIQYQYGTDVVVKSVWEGFIEVYPEAPDNGGGNGNGGNGSGGGSGGNGGGGQPSGQPGGNPGQNGPPPTVTYREPPFRIFEQLEGVESAARVLKTPGNAVVAGKTAGQGTVLGIDNTTFGNVAWFRDGDLLPHHQNEYLNLLGFHEAAVLVPEGFAKRYRLEPGNIMNISINQQSVEFVVAGIVPYWPSQYPDEEPFFITNLDYIYDQVPMIPYEVWLKMKAGALTAPLMEELANQGIQLASIEDMRIELAQQEKHPSRGGVFGILSLGFLVSVIVSLVGYVLYWFFNLSSRVVQFGVLRAMGLSRKQLTGMLLLEQGFTAGLAICLGIVIGKIASLLYLPFLETSESAKQQVPPFRVVFDSQDTMQLYIVVAVMMLIGAGLLLMHIRKLRVHQAVKLGEER
ncbi:ABC transporter permease [Marinicrinis lubricantis]|uniref:ABC transporter permease n=1 Tax=Marinicrinis lubricantis TaxID=2086470 RepID=A0ABW1ISH6_9BACL